MKIKVTQRLTYPEARKVHEQHTPEFSFSKIVQSVPAKPETKTTSQFHENDFKITESSKVIIARKPKQSTTAQVSKSSEKSTSPKNQTKPNIYTKVTKPIVVTDRVKKGSDDPIQNHNKFGVLADDGAMDTDESVVRSGARTSLLQRSSFQSILS